MQSEIPIMLSQREAANILAALLFWKEEMCPHPEQVMWPYFERSDPEPLSAEEIDSLRGRLRAALTATEDEP